MILVIPQIDGIVYFTVLGNKWNGMSKIKEYQKDDLTIIWEAEKCIHSAKCAMGLASVFKPRERPWIQPEHATIEDIKNTIDKCPSGALSYKVASSQQPIPETESTKIEVVPGGPLLVFGTVEVKRKDGTIETKTNRCALCRCGASTNKPYCDGTHKKLDFDQ